MSNATKSIVVKIMEINNIPISQQRFDPQKIAGWTPVIIWTCLALVTRSINGKTKNTETNKLNPSVKDVAYWNAEGLMNELAITSSNFVTLCLGKGWFATVIDCSASG